MICCGSMGGIGPSYRGTCQRLMRPSGAYDDCHDKIVIVFGELLDGAEVLGSSAVSKCERDATAAKL